MLYSTVHFPADADAARLATDPAPVSSCPPPPEERPGLSYPLLPLTLLPKYGVSDFQRNRAILKPEFRVIFLPIHSINRERKNEIWVFDSSNILCSRKNYEMGVSDG